MGKLDDDLVLKRSQQLKAFYENKPEVEDEL
jgi:hypothetical protein